MTTLWAFLRYFIIFCVISVAFAMGGFFFITHHQCIDLSALEHYDPGKPSILLDDEGNEWGRFQLDKREPVPLSNMPRHLINAFVAAEDWHFFSHAGISWKGITRSILVNIYHGKIVQGASTITQQLVKLLFFDMQKTLKRKIKEQLMALFVERQFTKEQILQTYLNHVYFGCGIYGVEAASQRFWGKSVGDITLDEAALLAAIVKSPARYCPLLCPLSAQHRRDIVLSSMKKLRFIDDQEYTAARSQVLHLATPESDMIAPHLKETIRLFLEDLVGKNKLYCGGLKVQTTLNQNVQRLAERAFKKHFEKLHGKFGPEIDGSLISVDSKSGEIKALIGGLDFNKSQLNRAYRKRQMGSIFKPIVYAAALEKGMSFADTDIDEEFELELPDGSVWRPQNNTCTFEGTMTLARALSLSNNIVTIKTLLNTGVENVIKLAQKCRIQGPLHPYPSLALGCVDVTLKEAAGAFNVFANSGMYVEPHIIKWVKNEWGEKLWKKNPEKEQVMHPRISSQVAKVLGIGMGRFKRRVGATAFDYEGIGKTGTTNDCRTSWFAGSTPEMTTAIYIGRDDNQSLGKNVYGVSTAFPIWFNLHQSLTCAKKKFSYDTSLRELVCDWRTGQPSVDKTNPHVFALLV